MNADERFVVDPKRSCRAVVAHVFDEDGGAPNGVDGYPPGTCQRVSPDRLMFTCPGCGQWGGVRALPPPKRQNAWEIAAGSLDDAATLTLRPSIHCVGCCGWHGFLTAGEFRSC